MAESTLPGRKAYSETPRAGRTAAPSCPAATAGRGQEEGAERGRSSNTLKSDLRCLAFRPHHSSARTPCPHYLRPAAPAPPAPLPGPARPRPGGRHRRSPRRLPAACPGSGSCWERTLSGESGPAACRGSLLLGAHTLVESGPALSPRPAGYRGSRALRARERKERRGKSLCGCFGSPCCFGCCFFSIVKDLVMLVSY